MPRFTTAIFDLDGTIADTLPLIYRAFARYVEVYEQEHDAFVTAFHGLDAVIRRAAEAGMRLGVVTGKSRQTALYTLERIGLLPVFSAVYAGDDVERQKPDPEAVVRILADLGHDPHLEGARAGAFVGDSAADVLAGRAAGLTTIAVSWGSPDHDDLHAAHPDHLVHDGEELSAVLGL